MENKAVNNHTRGWVAVAIVLAVLLIDQWLKIWVKTSMHLYESIRFTDWFYLYFTENPGMAFGWEFIGKIFLTSFRIVAVLGIIYYLVKIIREKANYGYISCISLVLAGAIGNIIDCIFYGAIFNESTRSQVAEFVPFGTGYDKMMLGKVVDMFYFPLFSFDWPTWVPMIGDNNFVFFSPIFNFADAAISCGVIALILFFRKKLAHL